MPQHVIQRGNNRQQCFQDFADKATYMMLLLRYLKKYDVDVHAWVFMSNHTHLLVTPHTENALSGFMKSVGQAYAQSFNHKYGRSGSLWEGRFKSCLVDTESYFLQCQRYIELNPVKAGMVEYAGDFQWSSYRCHAYGMHSPLHTPHSSYLEFQPDSDRRYESYRAFVDSPMPGGLEDLIRYTAIAGKALGSEKFQEEIAAQYG
ncbi:transposase [Marinobacter sp.]|uniref:transposase n=1 Tax=Marinobacter sp. TaxID=50741 RepID=UPI0035671D8B